MAQPSLFDYLNDITTNKKYLLDESDNNKNYTPFMINRGLGQHLDTILLANEMNKRPGLSKLMHHDFLWHSVDAKKRFGKWAKQDDTDLDLVAYLQDKYVINKEVALEYMKLLDKDELKTLKLEHERKGGTK